MGRGFDGDNKYAHAVSVLSRRLQLSSETVRKSGSITFTIHCCTRRHGSTNLLNDECTVYRSSSHRYLAALDDPQFGGLGLQTARTSGGS